MIYEGIQGKAETARTMLAIARTTVATRRGW
jgi:hypothetical protein